MLTIAVRGRRGSFPIEAEAKLEGGCVALFGPSGSGKTTLLQMIAGLLDPDEGRIVLGERTLFDKGMRIGLPPHRRRVGLMFQEDRLFPHYSVEGNLRYGEPPERRGPQAVDFRRVVDLLELGGLLQRSPGQLSGGEKRRVALGRVLLTSPDLLMLDEPLVGLDQGLKSQILPFLERIRDQLEVPIIYVSHELSEVLQLTQRMWIIQRGKLIASGSYLDLVQNRGILDTFLPNGLCNVFPMNLLRHDPGAGCSYYVERIGEREAASELPPLELQGPLSEEAAGSEMSLVIRPEDIALATERVESISVRNQIRGRVRRFIEADGRVILEIDAGAAIIVELSGGSFSRMRLERGSIVWCLIKATGIRIQGKPSSFRD